MKYPLTQFSRLLWAAFLIVGLRLTAMADITSGLIMYLPFNESSGTNTADLSAQGHGGALFGFTNDSSQVWVPGVSGNALKFDNYGTNGGQGTYVITTNTIPMTDSAGYTMSFWIKANFPNPPYSTFNPGYVPSTYPNAPRLFQPAGVTGTAHWMIWTYTSGLGFFNTRNGSTPWSEQYWSSNYWHHFTCTYNRVSGAFTAYLDGISMGGGSASRTGNPSNNKWVIGHQENLTQTANPGDNFGGYLDEVRLYNRLLTAADVQELYYSTGQQPLAIETQPVGGTIYSNDWYTLSVKTVHVEPGIAYQWRLNGTAIPSATKATLNLNPVKATDDGNYDVVVTNTLFAGSSITSSIAALTITGSVDLTNGLMAYYTFDEGTGTTIADSSTNAYSATLYGTMDGSQWVAGVPGLGGNAVQLNATDVLSNNYVKTDSAIDFGSNTNVYSFAFWAKRVSDNNPNNPRILSPAVNTQHWMLWSPGTGMGLFTVAQPCPDPVKDVWQHYVFVYNRSNWIYGSGYGTYSLYINGIKVASNQRTAASSGTANPALGSYARNANAPYSWVFGNNEALSGFTDPWRGCFDDMRIYNRELTPQEVAALYSVATAAAPSFVNQPPSKNMFVGERLRLAPSVSGTAPITYQWYTNGSPILNATNLIYSLANAQTSDSGSYTLVATGAISPPATSSVAAVTVSGVTSVTNGLAGYWKFDETTGSAAADSSGNGNSGTVFNSSSDGGQWTSGQVGGALQFRGTGLGEDYVKIPNWPKALSGTMSLSAWVREDVAPAPAYQPFVAAGGSSADGVGQFALNVMTNTAMDIRGAVQNGYYGRAQSREGTTLPLPTNSWQHVMIVANGSNLILYRNGVQKATTSYTGTLPGTLANPTNALTIGALLAAGDSSVQSGTSWQGKIDDVAYWTRGLSPTHVFAVFAAGLLHGPATDGDLYTNYPPIIVTQPQGETLYYGDNFWPLSVSAASATTIAYQWRNNGVAILNATNATYNKGGIAASVAFSDAGNYTVVVSNSSGSVTSAVAVVTVVAPTPQLEDGMVLHLKLDETSGTAAADASGNANTGTLFNYDTPDAAWTSGIFTNALKFNLGDALTRSNVVWVTDAPNLNFGSSSIGISLWVKAATGVIQTNGAGLLCKGYGNGGESYGLDFYSGGPVSQQGYRFFVRNAAGIVNPTAVIGSGFSGITNGTWEHVAVIYDTANARSELYVNGVLKATGTTETSMFEATAYPLNVGARDNGTLFHDPTRNGPYQPWQGAMDDVRLYNRALTPIEVRALTYQGRPPSLSITSSSSQVIVSWPMEATAVYELQANPDLSGTWTNVPSITTNSVSVTPSLDALFYRLHRK